MSRAQKDRRVAQDKEHPKKPAWTEQEMRERLEEIARNETNHSAAIQAMRFLRELDDGEQAPAQEVADLYELADPKRRPRTKAA